MRCRWGVLGALTVALLGCETRPPSVDAPRTIDCDPLPDEDAPCSEGLCLIPGEPDSYMQCIGGRWVRITEQPLEQGLSQ
jgi:hypothetical protein